MLAATAAVLTIRGSRREEIFLSLLIGSASDGIGE
jgi:hypothetical protein